MHKSRKNPPSSWELAARLCQTVSSDSGKAESTLDQYVNTISSRERAYCQRLFYAVIRHRRLIDETLAKWVPRTPRPRLAGILKAALADALASEADAFPKVVDFWVGNTRKVLSKGEAGLVNAVLRRSSEWWASDEVLRNHGLRYSHPAWLAQKWSQQLGADKTAALMTWNQQPAEVFLRLRGEWQALPAGCQETLWPGFVRWTGQGDWAEVQALLDAGRLYAQDPGTRLAPALLNVQPGEHVLDLCAAPGGKSLLLADALGSDTSGLLVCVEAPGPRIEQLDENLRKLVNGDGAEVQLLAADVREIRPEEMGQFDAVLLDTPCSNTGVIRRRPDVKWRLHEASIAEMATLQGVLLAKASDLVRPGGRLVYSTCSIETEENEDIVKAFLAEHPDFSLRAGQTHLPVDTDHDGAGCFLLERT